MHEHHWPGEFRFCPMCGTELEDITRAGAVRRHCPTCDYIHWRNPGVGAAVVVWDEPGQLLLVRRGPEVSRTGFWSIPAGYVNYGEEVRAAAARELQEETGLVADVGEVVWVASNFHDPAKLTVGVWFAGKVVGGTLHAGDDASDARFFPTDDLPPLAFETDVAYLQSLGIEVALPEN